MNKSTLCRYPFDSIAIKQFDSAGNPISAWPCCIMGNNTLEEVEKKSYVANKMRIEKENLINSTPLEIFQHENFRNLRKDSASGIRNPACKICWEQEDRGIKSGRQYSIENQDDLEETILNPSLKVIDLSINNLCNLACRMCSPSASSLLMKDYNYFKKNNLIERANNSIERWSGNASSWSFKLRNLNQWKWLTENSSSLGSFSLRLSGGEPFYNDDVLHFLDYCIEQGTSKNITLEFHTNATLFDDTLIEKLKQFKNNLNFSIDGCGKVYEYIRYPASWTQLDNSVRLYIENINQRFININFIAMITNLFNVPDFLSWITSLNTQVSVSFSEVHFPTRGISLRNLPIPLLNQAKEEIIAASKNIRVDISNLLNIIGDAITNNTENKNKVYDELHLFDLSRNQDFRNIIDERIIRWLF